MLFENERQEGFLCVNKLCRFCSDIPDVPCDAVNSSGDPSYSDCETYIPGKLLRSESTEKSDNKSSPKFLCGCCDHDVRKKCYHFSNGIIAVVCRYYVEHSETSGD